MKSVNLNKQSRKGSSTGSSGGSQSPRIRNRSPYNRGFSPEASFQSSQCILNENKFDLSEYEEDEILLYDKIYFYGKGSAKILGNFTDEEGNFIGIIGDHVAYRYEILSLIGRGSFGQVFECFDHKRLEKVALKVINCKSRFSKSGKNESNLIELLTDIDEYGCVLQKLASFEFRGHFVMVFELFNQNLLQFLEKIKFRGVALSVLKRIAVQVLITLKTIHSLNYIHCDLKPENLMFKYENKSSLKVIDYGSACCSTEDLLDYVQSRYYRAPEVVLGCNYNEKVDIWSFGCILVECFTGQPLFPADSEQELLLMIQEKIGKPCKRLLKRAKFTESYVGSSGFITGSFEEDRRTLDEVLANSDEKFADLVKSCIMWNPDDRISAEIALNHPWIRR